MKPLRIIDDFLNKVTMYALVVYGLGALSIIAIALGFLGKISLGGMDLLESVLILIAVTYVTNKLLAKAWDAPANDASWRITALILFFIMPPPTTVLRLGGLIVAGVIAMASKYILAWNRKHIFNPAAIAAVITGWLGLAYASWWVASPEMLPFTLILGLLVTRKVRRFQLLFAFVAAALVVLVIVGMQHGRPAAEILSGAFTSWPVIFLGTIMLTEPATLPPFLWQQLVYGVIVGAIFASQVTLGPIASTPAVALVLGNLYSYAMSPKYKLRLKLKSKTQLSSHIYDFAFVPERKPSFVAGQYAEWTLPHAHTDARGNRRTFTIASSPTRDEMHIGIKVYEPSSSFKKALLQMQPGDSIMAGQFAGGFVLPKDQSRKLVFIAGGIGITPFMSMLTYMADTRQQRDVVLFYLVSSTDDIGYSDLLSRFAELGVHVVTILGAQQIPASWTGRTGFLTPDVLAAEAPDFQERTFYISGPNRMVEHYHDMLRRHHIAARHIVTDYFSGY